MTASAKSSLVEEGLTKAVQLLEEAATPGGFVAATGDEQKHYLSIWARDSSFTALGSNLASNQKLLAASWSSLETLASHQAEHGQIPVVVWPEREYWDWGDGGCTDGTALFVIALRSFLEASHDSAVGKLYPAAKKAVTWLSYQDSNNFGLIDSPQSSDWMDSSLVRSGKVFYNNVLYCAALTAISELAPTDEERKVFSAQANTVKEKINLYFWPEPNVNYGDILRIGADFGHEATGNAWYEVAYADRCHYVSHIQRACVADKCDVLANSLAVIFDIAPLDRAIKAMHFMHDLEVAKPYPARTYPHPFGGKYGDTYGMYIESRDNYQRDRWRNPPGSYHNGAVWPFVGGFYVAALQKVGMNDEARDGLEALALANQLGSGEGWGFHEWINCETQSPDGPSGQTWNAGAYVFAYQNLLQPRFHS